MKLYWFSPQPTTTYVWLGQFGKTEFVGAVVGPPGGGGGASALGDLTDVLLTDPQDGDVLKFDAPNWVNAPDATGGGGGGALVAPNVYVTDDIGSLDPNDFAAGDFVIDASDDVNYPVWNVYDNGTDLEFSGDYNSLRADPAPLNAAILEVAGNLQDFENYVNNEFVLQLQTVSEKGNPYGYPGLDPSGKVPLTHIPDITYGMISDLGDFANIMQIAWQGDIVAATSLKQNTTEKGIPNGYAGLDGTGRVPAAQLPAYVDDVVEAANFAALPGTGETGKVYVTLDDNNVWRWSGSVYVEIAASPGSTDVVTEGATNKYFTEARVLATPLTGYAAAGSLAAITAADTVLSAMGKIGKYMVDLGTTAFTAAGRAMLTAADAAAQTALLSTFTTALKGLVPAPGTATGKFLKDDGTWDTPAGGGVGEGPDKFVYFNDCYSTVSDQMAQTYTANGTNAIVAWPFAGDPSGSGFMRHSLGGSGGSARAAWGSANIANAHYLRQGASKFRTRNALMTLSDGTLSYRATMGFLNDLTSDPTYGCFFRYNHAVNGGRWEAVCVAGGSPTVADTGVTAVIDTMTVFEIEVNAAGTSVAFKINGTTVATITTTIPGAGINLGQGSSFIRLAGTSAINAALTDYWYVEQEFSGR